MHPVSPPLPAIDEIQTSRIVLRDGSVASVRLAEAGDREAMRRFFSELSPESRRKRFLSAAEPSDDLIARLCDSTDPARALTLVAFRNVSGEIRLIGLGSYFALTETVGEVAFAVDDHFQGRGIATVLLERLAVVGAAAGFRRFQAETLADNTPMLEVFRDSGFVIRSKNDAGCIDVQLSLTPSFESVSSSEERHRLAAAASLRPMLEPEAVAVVGASRDADSLGGACSTRS